MPIMPSYGVRNPGRLHSGFTLIEIAVALLILSLLTAGAVAALRLQAQRASFQQTQTALNEAKDAILGFAIANGRLPCPARPLPANPNDAGIALAPPCDGNNARGLIPWRTLGIQGLDAWDQYLSYQITQDFATAPISAATPTAATAPEILQTSIVLPLARVAAPGSVAFAIWSHGANGHNAINVASVQQPAGVGTLDEGCNDPANPARCDIPMRLVSRAASEAGSPMGDFDDTLLWVSRFSLFKQLIDAGQNVPLPAGP